MPITYIGGLLLVVAAGAVSFRARHPNVPLMDLAVAVVAIGCTVLLVVVAVWLAWQS